jgi:hypothetical protein
MKIFYLVIFAIIISGCLGDRYEPILGPKTSQTPAVFERLPGEIKLFGIGGDSVNIYHKCLKLSKDGNADATYAAAIIVGQGKILEFQTKEEKEKAMMGLMYKAKDQGSKEASEFVKTYEKVGIQKW